MARCVRCGAELAPDLHFCTSCGAPVAAAATASGPPSSGPPSGPPPSGPPSGPPPGGPPSGPPAGPPPAAPGDTTRNGANQRTLLFVGLAILAVIGIIAAILVASSGGNDEAGGEVFLEAADNPGANAFTATVAAPRPSSTVRRSTTTTTKPSTTTSRPTTTRRGAQTTFTGVHGSVPGLYGGTRDNSSCDADALVAFLQANPEKATAWASVFGGRPADIPAFVRTLTPVLLDRDTRVTNHGFSNGRATPLQSILQAGTAVLVDEFGIPRVKCNCGNPLKEPVPISTTPRYQGTPWPDFSPTTVIVVQPEIKVTVFVLNDVVTGERFTRPVASSGNADQILAVDQLCSLFPDDPQCGGVTSTTRPNEPQLGTGDVQITLRWQSTADLDLSVTDPSGATLSYDNRSVPSGGQLDVDSNGSCVGLTSSPVENVFWPPGGAPDGEYTIVVSYFDTCPGGEGPQSFTLEVTMGGGNVSIVEASTAGRTKAMELQSTKSVSDTLQPGQDKAYKVSKLGGSSPSSATTATTATTAGGGSPESITTTTLSCAEQFPDDYMQRTLCEHNPG